MGEQDFSAGELLRAMNASEGKRILTEMNGLNASVYMFSENEGELVESLEEVTWSPEGWLLFTPPLSHHLQAFRLEIGRLLHNFVASSLSLIDHTRRVKRGLYTDSERENAYDQKLTAAFVNDPLSEFVKGLRQYCQIVRFHHRPSGAHRRKALVESRSCSSCDGVVMEG